MANATSTFASDSVVAAADRSSAATGRRFFISISVISPLASPPSPPSPPLRLHRPTRASASALVMLISIILTIHPSQSIEIAALISLLVNYIFRPPPSTGEFFIVIRHSIFTRQLSPPLPLVRPPPPPPPLILIRLFTLIAPFLLPPSTLLPIEIEEDTSTLTQLTSNMIDIGENSNHTSISIQMPILYGPEERPIMHGPPNRPRLDRWMLRICDSRLTWFVLFCIGLGCSAAAPFFITNGHGLLPPFLCVGGGLLFAALYCIGIRYREWIIRFRVPLWIYVPVTVIFGGGSVALSSLLPATERAIGGFSLLALAIFCWLQAVQPSTDFGGLIVFGLLPLQVTVLRFHHTFSFWYPLSIVLYLLLVICYVYITGLMERRYRR